MAGKNVAAKYSNKVDERFTRESQAMMALNNNYEFSGVDTVKVFSIPVVPMGDYTRTGVNRYGVPNDLQRNVQTLKVKRDRAFTFIIDKGDKIQSQMVSDAGQALSRQTSEVWIPEFDTYVFRTLAAYASQRGNYSAEPITKANAYEMFLNANEKLGNKNVPDQGRVCFSSYRFANLLKQDSAFMKYGDKSQEMLIKGVIGEVDGTKIVKVPSSRLPAGAAFLLVHPMAATAPKQLEDYKIHDNPPGINGWLVEGRVIYDAFVLNEKSDAIYYHGSQEVLKDIVVMTAPSATSNTKTVVVIPTEAETGHTFVYKTFANTEDAPAVTYGAALSDWTAVANSEEITPAEGHALIMVAEVDGAKKPVGTGIAAINMA